MTVSDRPGAARPGLAALLAGGVLLALGSGTAAQQGPIQLLPPEMRSGPAPVPGPGPELDPTRPPGDMPPLDPPREVGPAPGDSGLTEEERAVPSEPAAPPEPRETGEATPLPESIGILTPRVGGFDDDLWGGTPGGRAADLLAALPVATASPVMADLRRRLLLSEQRPPDGMSALELLRIRLDTLVRAGAPAGEVMALADPVGRDGAVDRARLHALLVEADDTRACSLTRSVGVRYPDPIWQQAAIHCDLLDGDTDAALLGLTLLREMGADAGPGGQAFTLLAERLAGLDSPAPDSFAGASPVAWRLLRRLPEVAAPADARDPARPWTARALALAGDGGPPALRAAAAEQAAAAGALPVETLGQVWADIADDPRDLDTPPSQAILGGTAYARALTYAILFRVTNPTRLADGLMYPLGTSRVETPALYPVHARLYAPLIREIPVDPRVPVFLGTAAGSALYAAGSIEAGRVWLGRLMAQGESGDRDAEDAAALLWPLARMADPALGAGLPTERLLLWRQAKAARLGETPEDRRALDRAHVRLLRLFEAMGVPIGEAHWLPLRATRVFVEAVTVDGGHTDTTRLEALDRAVAGDHTGEAVALALLALGEGGPAAASVEALDRVLRALRALGLEAEARRLAVEALAVG
jgi:hypothetical protein